MKIKIKTYEEIEEICSGTMTYNSIAYTKTQLCNPNKMELYGKEIEATLIQGQEHGYIFQDTTTGFNFHLEFVVDNPYISFFEEFR